MPGDDITEAPRSFEHSHDIGMFEYRPVKTLAMSHRAVMPQSVVARSA